MPSARKKAVVVGIVGGIAAGKSFVAERLENKGAVLIHADELAHGVLQKPLVARTLIQQFGEGITDERGVIDRSKLANLVFGTEPAAAERRSQLEHLVHPMIHAEVIHRLRTLNSRDEGPPNLVVIDAPLLLEAGWRPMCDIIIFVDTPELIRQARALERGWTQAEFIARESAQMSLQDKRSHATHTVDGQDEPNLASQLGAILTELEGPTP